MKEVDPVWLLLSSDLFVNLAAGWLAAIFIVSPASKWPRKVNLWVLTGNLLFATFSLVAAFKLRKLTGL